MFAVPAEIIMNWIPVIVFVRTDNSLCQGNCLHT